MADLKISALTASTTPLAGTEVLPIVQSSTTKQVSVANLTAGRAISALSTTVVGAANSSASSSVSAAARTTAGQSEASFSLAASSRESTNTRAATYTLRVDPDSDFGASALKFEYEYDGTPYGARMTLTSAGNLAFPSGAGIDFSATASTGTSELLADYEEGTWTPVDGSGAGLVFTTVTGFYTKVGRLVTCTFGLTFPATASGADVTIGGLPYTAISSGPPNVSGGSLTYTTAAVNSAGFAIGQGATTGLLFNSAGAFFANATFSGTILRMQFTYTAA